MGNKSRGRKLAVGWTLQRAGHVSWVKLLTKLVEPKVMRGGESRMNREVIRKVLSIPDLDCRARGGAAREAEKSLFMSKASSSGGKK